MKILNEVEISVILPTYNRANLISRAINSVINQTYQKFQLIIVDDDSIDNTEMIIKEYNNPKICYLKHPYNMGPAEARNTGIKYARSNYLAFIDSDDKWFPEKLEKQLEVFLKYSYNNLGIVYSDMIRVDKDNREIYWRSPDFKLEVKDLYKKSLNYEVENIGISTAMIRKECLKKIGYFDPNLKRLEDLEIFIRLSKYFNFYHLEIPLIYYYETESGVSSSIINLINARKYILNKYFEDISTDKKILSNHYFLIGFALYQDNNVKESKKYLGKSIITYPSNLKNTFRSLLIITTNGKLYNFLSVIKRKIIQFISIVKYGFYILRKKDIKVFLIKISKFFTKNKNS